MEASGRNPSATKRFLLFLHEEHIGWHPSPEYVEFLTRNQDAALTELIAAGLMSQEAADAARLPADDLAPWDHS